MLFRRSGSNTSFQYSLCGTRNGSPKGTGREGVEDARLVRLWVGESDDPGRLLLLEVGHQVPVQFIFILLE
jgi:hypothetical protein